MKTGRVLRPAGLEREPPGHIPGRCCQSSAGPPAVNERSFCALKLLEKRGGGAFRQLELGEPGGVAVEQSGVRLEMFDAANDARKRRIGVGQRSGRVGWVCALERDKGIRQAAEIDAGALAELYPV